MFTPVDVPDPTIEDPRATDNNPPDDSLLSEPGLKDPSLVPFEESQREHVKQTSVAIRLTQLLQSGRLGTIWWDKFIGAEVIDTPKGRVPLDDAELTRLLLGCELNGLTNISPSAFKKIVHFVAKENPFDSAQERLSQLPAWDRTKRVERFLPDYLGTPDTPYEQAVGCYLWTAMVARILIPGCKVDMIPVLVGKQGIGKTRLLSSIAPIPEWWGEVRLTDSSDLVRKVIGKVVVGWEEMRGIRGRVDADEVKTFITSPYVELRSKTNAAMDRHLRRFTIIGTSNRRDFLRDPTGHRRYLPFDVHFIDLEKVRSNNEQLWAEALHIVMQRQISGQSLVDYVDAERLAVAEYQRYIDQARWVDDETLLAWLKAGNDRFRTEDALKVVGVDLIRQPDRLEMVKSLKQLGFDFRSAHVRGSSGKPKRWHQHQASAQQNPSTPCP